jgi:hypothetical protein
MAFLHQRTDFVDETKILQRLKTGTSHHSIGEDSDFQMEFEIELLPFSDGLKPVIPRACVLE